MEQQPHCPPRQNSSDQFFAYLASLEKGPKGMLYKSNRINAAHLLWFFIHSKAQASLANPIPYK